MKSTNPDSNEVSPELWLEDPKRFKAGQKKAHSNLRIQETKHYFSLNGKWKFQWSKNWKERESHFYQFGFDTTEWTEIEVPANWQLEGWGTPIYVNDRYPFPRNLPHIPLDQNPLGQYKRTFILPNDWLGQMVYLVFESVKSAAFFWTNGQWLGYNQDSKTPIEFLISPYLKSGENEIAVEVYRWCDGSYLECQDFWRLSGIERAVYLLARPKVHIRDFFVQADLANHYTDGHFQLKLEFINHLASGSSFVHNKDVYLKVDNLSL